MKKHLSVIFVVLVIMAMFTSTAFAAPAQTGKNVTLVSVDYQEGGIILMFQTSGLTNADLNNRSFFANSNSQDIYCNFVDDTTNVRCVVAKKLAQNEGKNFHGTLAGIGFWGTFPKNSYCPEGEIEWVGLEFFQYGTSIETDQVPTSFWEEISNDADWLQYINDNGYTYRITGAYCASGGWGPV